MRRTPFQEKETAKNQKDSRNNFMPAEYDEEANEN